MGKKQEKPKKEVAKRKKSSPRTKTPSSVNKFVSNDKNVLPVEKVDVKLHYQMHGPKVYGLDDELADEIENNVGKTFAIADEIKGRKADYKVQEILGTRTYVVKSSTSRKLFVMKTESSMLPIDGPILKRELLFYSIARVKLNPLNRSHFLNIVDQSASQQKSKFGALFMTKANFSLSEVRTKKLNGEFSVQTAIRLCMITLQAIHDVHLNHYVHRDIQPKNFLIGNPGKKGASSILITGLSYSYDTLHRDSKAKLSSSKKLAKTKLMSSVFQSRQYHLYEEVTNCSADLESWIFMCYDFFSSKALPWSQSKLSERDYLNHKEAFFLGVYDNHFKELKIPIMLNIMRRKIECLKPNEPIDYPFFAYMILQLAMNKNVVWSEKFEWQDNSKESIRSKTSLDETTDDNETGTGTIDSAPSSTNEKPSPVKAKKPNKKLTKPQSVDAEDETVEPANVQVKPSKNAKPAATPKKPKMKPNSEQLVTKDESEEQVSQEQQSDSSDVNGNAKPPMKKPQTKNVPTSKPKESES